MTPDSDLRHLETATEPGAGGGGLFFNKITVRKVGIFFNEKIIILYCTFSHLNTFSYIFPVSFEIKPLCVL